MWNDLIDGDATGQILTAWIAKEELRALLADRPHRRAAARRRAPAAPLQQLVRPLGDARARAPGRHHRGLVARVLGFLQTGVTNARTEATNRTVKTAARTAYGFRNLDNQRRRVRFACTRRHRRATAC